MRKSALLLFIVMVIAVLSGCKDQAVPYKQENHGAFAEEFAPHEKTNGWWYITGYLYNAAKPSEMYAYQYTQIDTRGLTGLPMYMLQLAVTNLQTGEHFFEYHLKPMGLEVYANSNTVSCQPWGLLNVTDDSMNLSTEMKKADLSLHLDMGKGAFWHGDDGVLIMGLPNDPVQRTVYYSYTNMPTAGTLTLRDSGGKQTVLAVTGKSWFDRQWGPYRMTDAQSSFWEWFSLRFFDDEEVMLFAFPQTGYQHGTYIKNNATSEKLTNYSYTPLDYKKVEGACYSFGWDLTMPGVKEGHYRIEPMGDGQFHMSYFEMMAKVINDKEELVGYAFVELLPGIREGMCD